MATLLTVEPNAACWREGIARLLRTGEAQPLAVEASMYASFGFLPLADAVAYAMAKLSYFPDPDNRDLWRSPALTLQHGGGDCEDLAIAAASALLSLGVRCDVVIGNYRDSAGWGRHAWVEGNDGKGPFLLEATTGAVFRRIRPGSYQPLVRNGTLIPQAS